MIIELKCVCGAEGKWQDTRERACAEEMAQKWLDRHGGCKGPSATSQAPKLDATVYSCAKHCWTLQEQPCPFCLQDKKADGLAAGLAAVNQTNLSMYP